MRAFKYVRTQYWAMATAEMEEPVGNTYRKRVQHGFVDVEVTEVHRYSTPPVYEAEVLAEENGMVAAGDTIRIAGHFLDEAYDPLDEI